MAVKVKLVGVIGALAVLSVLFVSGPALAAGDGDHWSVVNWVVPQSTLDALRQSWGKTFIEGASQPDRTMHAVMSVVVFFLALLLTGLAMRKLGRGGEDAVLPEPKFGLFTFFDLLAENLYGLMVDIMGEKHGRYFFPLIMTLAIFILFGNLLGAVPGFLPATDNFNTTLALGLVVFIVTHVYGVKEHGFIKYFAHFCGPIHSWVALPLMVLMFAIECISHIARPVSLGVRLMGNMFGDHKVLGIFLTFGLLVPLPVMVLGFLVAVVQTLVFCLLSIVYIAMAVEHAEEH